LDNQFCAACLRISAAVFRFWSVADGPGIADQDIAELDRLDRASGTKRALEKKWW
jgi:hypothetical protein